LNETNYFVKNVMSRPTSPMAIRGVIPVLPTPFDAAGRPDTVALQVLVRYLLRCGVDGMAFPGVASEVGQLSEDEREQLTERVLREVAGQVPVVVGVSSTDPSVTTRLARVAAAQGAAALMIAVPGNLPDRAAQIAHYQRIADAVPGAALMLQNVPPPAGAGLEPDAVLEILRAVPAIRYLKEETLPSGQRLSAVLAQAPNSLRGVLGGAGGRYITDELRRGACGTMPAIELAEVHVALFAAHRTGDVRRVRDLFTRMMPILNLQAVFRWSLTKHVLRLRGLIAHDGQRAAGPLLDVLDRQEVDAFIDDLQDLLLSEADLQPVRAESTKTPPHPLVA
jgi:4-hydroxy-tetrahydrodipicolinate synthase